MGIFTKADSSVDEDGVVSEKVSKNKSKIVEIEQSELVKMQLQISRLEKVASATRLQEVIDGEEFDKMVKTVRVSTIDGKIIKDLSIEKDIVEYFDNGNSRKLQEYKLDLKDDDSMIISVRDFVSRKEFFNAEFRKSSNDPNGNLETITVVLPGGEELEINKEAINL